MPLAKNDLTGQFVLSRNPDFIPESWLKKNQSEWILGTHPSLPVADICTEHGTQIGWLLGYPITQNGELYPQKPAYPVYKTQDPDENRIESELYKMGGRFIAVFITEKFSRLYLDPSGSLGAVYSTRIPLVASTTTLIDQEPHAWNEALIKAFGIPASDLWYPFGLTARKFVSRLLPNHYLDLNKWKSSRHWPMPSGLPESPNPDDSASKIIEIISNHIAAVADKHPIHLGLTAGRDTRVLLACARKHLDRIRLFTFKSDHKTVDSHIAGRIARKLDLNHEFLPIEYANQAQIDNWYNRTGQCVGGAIARIHPTQKQLDKNRALLPGMAGEVYQLNHYKNEDSIESPLEPEELLSRYGIPPYTELLTMAADWLSEVRPFNTYLKLDLCWIEQRLGCWGAPMAYGAENYTVCHLLAFSHRRIYELMLTLPYEYRKKKQLTVDICNRQWPELLDFPFNEFSKLTKFKKKLVWYYGHAVHHSRSSKKIEKMSDGSATLA